MSNKLTQLAVFCMMLVPVQLPAQDAVTDEDEKAIEQAIVGYVTAMNQGDAAGAAGHWSDTGVWIDPWGEEIVGAEAIQRHLTTMFANGNIPQIELLDVNVRFIAPNVATEEGNVVISRTGEVPRKTTYISVHVKTDKGWKLDSVRETVKPELSNYGYLQELEWMIGEWVDKEGDVTVETTCEWTKNQNYMLRTFRVINGDAVEMEGTQIVGWDAKQQQIRSWVFDSDGGFGHGTWKRDGSAWMVDSTFQTADGLQGSKVGHFTFINKDTFTYAATDQMLDGETLPDVGPFTISRKSQTNEQEQ